MILAAVGGLFLLAGAVFIYGAFSFESFQVVYNPQSLRVVGITTALLLALATAGGGFFLGFHSAGQRANTRNSLSWAGFFLSAAVLALALSGGIFFYLTKFEYTVQNTGL